MPLKLYTTISRIQNIPNFKNIKLINEFLEYMRNNASWEHNHNNNLKVVIPFGNFIPKINSFYDLYKKVHILEYKKILVKYFCSAEKRNCYL